MQNFNARPVIVSLMKSYINLKKTEDNLLDRYGPFWFWIGLIGSTLLGILGAFSDGSVVFGIAYEITEDTQAAKLSAAVISILLQLFLGLSIALTIWSFYKGKWKEPKYRTLTFLTFVLIVLSLGGSLYISKHSRQIVRGYKPLPLLTNTDSVKTLQAMSLLKLKTEQHQEDSLIQSSFKEKIAAVRAEQKAYQRNMRIRITEYENSGDLASASWLKKKQAAKNTQFSQEITQLKREKADAVLALLNAYRAERDTLKSENKLAINTVLLQNSQLESDYEDAVAFWGEVLMYGNFLINLLRALLLALFTKFIIDVLDWMNDNEKDIRNLPKGTRKRVSEQPGTAESPIQEKNAEQIAKTVPEQAPIINNIHLENGMPVFEHVDDKGNIKYCNREYCQSMVNKYESRVRETQKVLKRKPGNPRSLKALDNRREWVTYWTKATEEIDQFQSISQAS